MLSDVEVILSDGGSNSSIYNEANFFSFPTSLFYLSAANIVTFLCIRREEKINR